MIVVSVFAWQGGAFVIQTGVAPVVEPKDPSELFKQAPETGLPLCRPCSDEHHEHGNLTHACDGTVLNSFGQRVACGCQMCEIARTAQEMGDYLAEREREDGWPKD